MSAIVGAIAPTQDAYRKPYRFYPRPVAPLALSGDEPVVIYGAPPSSSISPVTVAAVVGVAVLAVCLLRRKS